MTSNYASEAAINYAIDLLNKKDWANSDQPKYVTRAAAVFAALRMATDPAMIGPEVERIATAELPGERVNQIMAFLLAGGVKEDVAYAWAPVTSKSLSNLIDWLKPMGRKASGATASAAPAKTQAAKKIELEDGMYKFDGQIYKVQHAVHGSGNQYAKKAYITETTSEECCGEVVNGKCVRCGHEFDRTYSVSFDYAPGVVAKLLPEHKLSYEEAKAFGALYGTCVRCGKTLTDELSIHLGIGPVCGGREFGGEFKAILKAAKLELKASA